MSSSYTRQKRGGEEDDSDGAEQSSSKKPRFDVRNPSALAPDALEDDAVLDADEFGHRGQKVRRNAVKVEGFESDSENEGFDARAEAKSKAKKRENRADDDDDMFAELEEDFAENDDEDETGGVKHKKQVRFLETDEIEGQVNSSRAGGKVTLDTRSAGGIGKGRAIDDDEEEDDDSGSDVGDDVRAALPTDVDKELGAGSKKQHAPLLDAFNMRAEQEEGRFDDAGNYVRKAMDPDAVHDSWLEGVSKKDMRKAKEAAEKREEERRQQSLVADKVLTSDVLKTLIQHLDRGETIIEALARLGKGLKHRPKWQNKSKKNQKRANGATEDVEMQEEDPKETEKKRAVEEITEAADMLLSRGQTDIYDTERELLTRMYQRETGEQWVDPPGPETTVDDGGDGENSEMWEFRWSDSRDGGIIHGPYDKPTMQSWSGAGYFSQGGAEFRVVGSSGPWNPGDPFS
ncbi:TPA_exp: Uncharacterized protein A8136_6823 [Trichophyton benhamiae CBS 112371]|uniref:GYF domain-containing protein n=1 Tax=Arthroderma benhamiae (strain ATCC MYA-4681 / CBS 112371) TaxID=663331 RepID=D4AS17_ARTBC|nr:uncharacterized protein ARB_07032 [Trichophyton benhamiae CBS 112371]EFE34081.1 hypothetical protein ARB_07032 [Trichophyton benhamiae CBS 112371]DAA77057.1 TPA_exp: Uncharacterized protein A8136_6823 [Trichophyton benhamiae CBS 112371]